YGMHVTYLGYVYPSNTGISTQLMEPSTKCECVANGTPPEDYVLRSAYRHWSDSLSESPNLWDRDFLTRYWEGTAAWQMTWGPDIEGKRTIGSALYNRGLGFLQTIAYDD